MGSSTTVLRRLVLPLALVMGAWIWRGEVAGPGLIQSSSANKTLLSNENSNISEVGSLSDEEVGENDLDVETPTEEAVVADLCFPWNEDEQVQLPSHCCSESYCKILRATTAYSECCRNSSRGPPQPRKVPAILITGTPRSGTVFVSSLLSSLGLHLTNDAGIPTSAGIVSWLHVYDDHHPSLWWTRPFDKLTLFRHVVQQVRDPLASITSIAFTEPMGDPKYIGFLARHIPMNDKVETFSVTDTEHDELRIRRTLEFYTGWHEAIMALGVPRFRLEDFVQQNNTIVPKLFKWAGRTPPDPAQVNAQIELNRRRRQRRLAQKKKVKHNQRKHRPTLEWDELCEVDVELTKRLLALSHTFGYYENVTAVCGE